MIPGSAKSYGLMPGIRLRGSPVLNLTIRHRGEDVGDVETAGAYDEGTMAHTTWWELNMSCSKRDGGQYFESRVCPTGLFIASVTL